MDTIRDLDINEEREDMILYPVYFVLLSMFLLNVSAYFDFAFMAIGVGSGMKTVAIQLATVCVVGLIMVHRRTNKMMWRELAAVVAVWVPLLLYTAFRVNSDNPYSELKFAKIVVMSFLCALTVTAAYLADSRTFLRLFPVVVIVLSALLGIEALVHPQQFKYRTVIERMTIDGMNPIWLARSFALAGLCLFLLPTQRVILKLIGLAIVVIGIIPTGSRGPLISLILTLSLWFMIRSKGTSVRMATTIVSAGMLVALTLLLAGDRIETVVNAYLSRDQGVGFIEESGRPQLFGRAMNDFYSSPVIGVGLGAFGDSAGHRSHSYSYAGGSHKQGYYPHNIALEILSELGIIGVILSVIVLRPGKWLHDMKNRYFYPFLLVFLFSMSSGDINANVGVIILGTLARLTSKYPLMNEPPSLGVSPAMDTVQ